MSEQGHQSTELFLDTPRSEFTLHAIGQRIGLLIDLHPTAAKRFATGNADAVNVRCIERAYDNAASAKSEEEAWELALDSCARTAMDMIDAYRSAISGDGDRLLAAKLFDEAMNNTIAALTIYAIDRQSGVRASEKNSSIDAFFAPGDYAHNLVTSIAFSRIESNRLTIGSETDQPLLVTNLIESRPVEIERNNYDDCLWIMGELADSRNPTNTQQSRRNLAGNFADMRYASELTEADYDSYLETVERAIREGHHANAEALTALPTAYLSSLRGRQCEATATFEAIIRHCARQLGITDARPHGLLQAAEFYYPGGLNGEIARGDVNINALCESYSGQEGLYGSLLPKRGIEKYGRHKDAHNALVEDVLGRYCSALFSDDAFAADYAKDLIRSMHERKWQREGAKIYAAELINLVMRRLAQTVRSVGEDTFVCVHNQFGLGAIDFFTERNIIVLAGLQNNDPQIINKLRSSDVTLAMFDGYGSNNEAPLNVIRQLQSTSRHAERIIIPWREPSDFYRMLALLKRRDVKFCNLVLAAHGLPGEVIFNRGDDKISVTSNKSVLTGLKTTKLPIDESQLYRIERDYMCNPRHAIARNAVNKKQIVAAACSTDVETWQGVTSIAETILQTIDANNTVVIGTANVAHSSTLHADGLGLRMTGHAAGEKDSDNAPSSSNMVQLTKSRTLTSRKSKRIQKKQVTQRTIIKDRVVV